MHCMRALVVIFVDSTHGGPLVEWPVDADNVQLGHSNTEAQGMCQFVQH